MTPAGNGVIQRKLALLDSQVLRLREHMAGMSIEPFRENWAVRAVAERTLQVCAEIMIDVAERLLALADAGPAATAAEAIEKLVQLGILTQAEPYRSMVRMRNIIVHGYEDVDPEILYQAATEGLADFRRFRDEVDRATRA